MVVISYAPQEPGEQHVDTMFMIPHIIPGAVIGTATITGFNSGLPVLTGTAWIVVIAMCIRRIPYTIRSSLAMLQQIPMTVEEASASLGATRLNILWKVITDEVFTYDYYYNTCRSNVLLYSEEDKTIVFYIYWL